MLIYIDYDAQVFSKESIIDLTKEFEILIANVSQVENSIPTYASTYEVSRNIYPIEIFIKISRVYFEKRQNLTDNLKYALQNWKEVNAFDYKINLTVIPMDWELSLDI